MTLVGRTLAVDFGEKRIGLALSDPLGITAQGLQTLNASDPAQNYQEIKALVLKHDIRRCVVGLPIRMSGEIGAQAQKTLAWADGLKQALESLGVEVLTRDERLTSKQADRLMLGFGSSRKDRKNQNDCVSAILILQNFLESQRSLSADPDELS